MKVLAIVALLFSISKSLLCQQISLVWNDGRQLNWNDFSGAANDSSTYAAESFAEVRYTYTFNTLKEFHFNVFAHFNKNTSWIKKEYESNHLLKHEQLHFDIAELFARKLKETFLHHTYTKNYATEIEQIFSEKKAEYHAMQNKYDVETNHSLNAAKQQEWEIFIHDELTKMKGT